MTREEAIEIVNQFETDVCHIREILQNANRYGIWEATALLYETAGHAGAHAIDEMERQAVEISTASEWLQDAVNTVISLDASGNLEEELDEEEDELEAA